MELFPWIQITQAVRQGNPLEPAVLSGLNADQCADLVPLAYASGQPSVIAPLRARLSAAAQARDADRWLIAAAGAGQLPQVKALIGEGMSSLDGYAQALAAALNGHASECAETLLPHVSPDSVLEAPLEAALRTHQRAWWPILRAHAGEAAWAQTQIARLFTALKAGEPEVALACLPEGEPDWNDTWSWDGILQAVLEQRQHSWLPFIVPRARLASSRLFMLALSDPQAGAVFSALRPTQGRVLEDVIRTLLELKTPARAPWVEAHWLALLDHLQEAGSTTFDDLPRRMRHSYLAPLIPATLAWYRARRPQQEVIGWLSSLARAQDRESFAFLVETATRTDPVWEASLLSATLSAEWEEAALALLDRVDLAAVRERDLEAAALWEPLLKVFPAWPWEQQARWIQRLGADYEAYFQQTDTAPDPVWIAAQRQHTLVNQSSPRSTRRPRA